jgi:hypothetical protein
MLFLFLFKADTTAAVIIRHSGLAGECLFLVKFFGGILVLFAIGLLIGKLLKINDHLFKIYKSK